MSANSARTQPVSAVPEAGDDLDALRRTPAPLISMFEKIADRWRLDRSQRLALLDIESASTYGKWRKEPERASLRRSTVERMGHVFAIYAATQAMFGRGEAADGFVGRPYEGPPCEGRAPIDLMTGGRMSDLARVRTWLDRERAR